MNNKQIIITTFLIFSTIFLVGVASASYTTDLLAGQNTDVGDVEIWNDATNLYVEYTTVEGWGMTETHLHAACSMEEIPQTQANKKGKGGGNPIPGHFEYSESYDPAVTVVDYAIPLSSLNCEQVYVAAHAVVKNCETESFSFSPELTWQRSSEENVSVYPGYGAQWTKEQGFAISLDPNMSVWDGGTSNQYFTNYSTRSDINWSSWRCTQPGKPSKTGTDLRRFQTTFNIPEGYYITEAALGSTNPGYESVIPMNDNVYVFMNGNLTFWGGTISVLDPPRTHFLGMERRATQPQNRTIFPETDGWHMDGTFPEISNDLLQNGENRLDVFVEEFWTGGGMHELGLTLQAEETTCGNETETAWADGSDFPGKNWATYFDYTLN